LQRFRIHRTQVCLSAGGSCSRRTGHPFVVRNVKATGWGLRLPTCFLCARCTRNRRDMNKFARSGTCEFGTRFFSGVVSCCLSLPSSCCIQLLHPAPSTSQNVPLNALLRLGATGDVSTHDSHAETRLDVAKRDPECPPVACGATWRECGTGLRGLLARREARLIAPSLPLSASFCL
jgi:hypothetical protein